MKLISCYIGERKKKMEHDLSQTVIHKGLARINHKIKNYVSVQTKCNYVTLV